MNCSNCKKESNLIRTFIINDTEQNLCEDCYRPLHTDKTKRVTFKAIPEKTIEKDTL